MVKRKPVASKIDSLQEVADAVQKRFGLGSLTLLPESSEFGAVKHFIDAGNWGLNRIVSGSSKGCFPEGRLTEVMGKESTGKSLVLSKAIAQNQKAGGICVLDDTEHAYLKEFGEIVGVNNEELLYSSSEVVEDVFDKMELLIPLLMKKHPDIPILWMVDSIAMVSSKAEKEKELDDEGKGYLGAKKAALIHSGVRKIVGLISKSRVSLVITNHIHHKMDVMYGDDEYCPGGDAIPYYASVRLRLRRKEIIRPEAKKTGEEIGIRVEAYTKKNKIVRPFQSCLFDILFDEGIDYTSGCADVLIKQKLIESTSVGWYKLPDGKKVQGKAQVEEYFKEHQDELEELM